MYFSCVNEAKERYPDRPLEQISPLLGQISAFDAWDKVTKGLLRMYKGEVLENCSFIKDFRFGSIVSFKS